MAANVHDRAPEALGHELGALRKEWYWFLALGILLIVAGIAAISYPVVATVAVVKFLGLLLLICGGAQILESFWAGRWSGFMLSLLAGVLYIVVGGIMISRTLQMELALTLLLGAFFLVGGSFRIVAAMTLRMNHWGWVLLNGVITTLLGMLILADILPSALYIIGLFVGIDMLFNGWIWVMLAFQLRSLPE